MGEIVGSQSGGREEEMTGRKKWRAELLSREGESQVLFHAHSRHV